jgi:hypothetical protein
VTPKIWAKTATSFNFDCTIQGTHRDNILSAYKKINEAFTQAVATGTAFKVFAGIELPLIFLGIPAGVIYIRDNKYLVSYSIFGVMALPHFICFCLMRKYRKVTTDAYGVIDEDLSQINSCLDANN